MDHWEPTFWSERDTKDMCDELRKIRESAQEVWWGLPQSTEKPALLLLLQSHAYFAAIPFLFLFIDFLCSGLGWTLILPCLPVSLLRPLKKAANLPDSFNQWGRNSLF